MTDEKLLTEINEAMEAGRRCADAASSDTGDASQREGLGYL